MNRVHVIGRKNHGKTTLVTELVKELTARGMRVATIKHTHHHHELDVPGKDSYRHREAGAAAVGILSPSMNAVFWTSNVSADGQRDRKYLEFEAYLGQCDLVIVEGDTQTTAARIEVWRSSLGDAPIAAEDASIKAVVTDDEMDLDRFKVAALCRSRSDVSAVADLVCSLAGL